jgi:fimbrial isopeptide formation D2 family protein
MGRLRVFVAFFSVSRGSEARWGVLAGIAFALSMFMLLIGVMVVLPVEQAEADSLELGPDGYFSALEDIDGDGQILPVIDKDSETRDTVQDGWAGTRRILFGKQKDTDAIGTGSENTVVVYGSAKVSGGYKTLGYGGLTGIESVKDANPFVFSDDDDYRKSATTAVAANEALLWSDDVVTSGIKFDSTAGRTNTFDSVAGSSPYQSSLAVVSNKQGETSNTVVAMNYSGFERSLLNLAAVEGVCTRKPSEGCADNGSFPNSYKNQTDSKYLYQVFPLSVGDLNKYLDATSESYEEPHIACPPDGCSNSVTGYWLRTALWRYPDFTYSVTSSGHLHGSRVDASQDGLRPAFRLKLDSLVLSAHSVNQSQVLGDGDSLRLTFVDEGWSLEDSRLDVVPGELMVSADEDASIDGYGWKAVDRAATDGSVFASGFSEDGTIDTSVFPAGKVFDFYVWGQEIGSAETGWSNRATTASRVTVKDGKEYVPPSYGIELTGRSDGALTAYKIGDYRDEVFDQTGALKSVRLDTPTVPGGLKTVLKDAAVAAGGGDVDADNPIGWMASRWLGYPTDPLSDDVTSAFSPYAGQLQVFAQELAKHTDALGTSAGSLEAGTFPQPESMAMLPVSGPGLYLIVDSTQSSGGSLPIIVGTKVFNEAMEDVVEDGMVDFADAGVKGKPRLGRAVLKTSITDVAKRIVNDAGVDGFDVGSEVEFEVALRVPDLSGLSGVTYDAYAFKVEDTAAPGLTLPAASEVKVLVDVPSPDTDVTATGGLTIGVSGQMLTVGGLKAVFAHDNGTSDVTNKMSAGSLIRLRYAAVLNQAHAEYVAPPGGGTTVANVNEATLTRSHAGAVTADWADNSDGTESRTATANVYSFRVDLVKVDKDTSKPLGDAAMFEVSRDGRLLKFVGADGVYRLAVAGETGSAAVVTKSGTGEDAGTLSLLGVEARDLSFRETQAPDGYFTVSDFTVEVVPVWNADASEVTVVSYRTGGTNLAYVSQDGRSVTVADPSKSLANLPYTGGVGILLLLIIGGVFLVFAIRPFYLSHRAEATANILM